MQHFSPLVRSPRLEAELRSAPIYLKRESANPTGTHKDRATSALAVRARSLGFQAVTAATCGSFGVSLAHFARMQGLACRVFVTARCPSSARRLIQDTGAALVNVDGTYEDAVEDSRYFANETGAFDANPDGPHAGVAVAAYKALAEEILDQLHGDADGIWVPASNGTIATGVLQAVNERSPATCVHVVGSRNNTAATASLRSGIAVVLDPAQLSESAINSVLTSWRSAQTRELLELSACGKAATIAVDVTDSEMVQASALLARCELPVRQPASAAVLAALRASQARSEIVPGSNHVLILTS